MSILEAWYGEKIRDFDSLDSFLEANFYSGKTIAELLDEGIELDFIQHSLTQTVGKCYFCTQN